MPNRHGQDDDYRYGFNGAEKDDEIRGSIGSNYNLGARMYDPRIGRMLSSDPWENKYPFQSSYAYFKNSPISKIDWKGFGGDPTESTASAFAAGANNAMLSYITAYGFGHSNAKLKYPNNLQLEQAYRRGQMAVDVGYIAAGGVSIDMGLTGLGAAAVMVVNIEGAIVTTPAAVITTVGSVILIGAGSYYGWRGAVNLAANLGTYNATAAVINASEKKKKAEENGSYTNTHESGKKYHGKGKEARAKKSAKEKAKQYNDPIKKTDWKPAKNDKEAFKGEYKRMQKDASKKYPEGYKNPNNYNKRQSPGKKL